MENNCPICQGEMNSLDEVYNSCVSCHLHLKKAFSSAEITNDILSESETKNLDLVTKFKIKLVRRFARKSSAILDVGTASGKFLYHLRKLFPQVAGIETNLRCVEYCKSQLNLDVVSDVKLLSVSKHDIICFWHSLEHIPLNESQELVHHVLEKNPEACFIVSVPNGNSRQFMRFREKWPYYDRESHLYQFSPTSLDMYFKRLGLVRSSSDHGFMYEFFGYLQGFVNLRHPINNYFYYRMKRGWKFNLSGSEIFRLDLCNFFYLAMFIPKAAIYTLIGSLEGEQAVLNYVYKVPTKHS
jgi:hypothetical protein